MSPPAHKQPTVIAFDPGVTTGIAVINLKGRILYTAAVDVNIVKAKAERLERKYKDAFVVIEKGPVWRSDSPLTRIVEFELHTIFTSATLVPPNLWKNHPAAKCTEQVYTVHERDAVRLGRWFLARRVTTHGKSHQKEAHTT